MSGFTDHNYLLRDVYFVLLPSENRPARALFQSELARHAGIRVLNANTDSQNLLQSCVVMSDEDRAVLEMIYQHGDEVQAEIVFLVKELEKGCTKSERKQLEKAKHYRFRFEVRHYERISEPQTTFPKPDHSSKLERPVGRTNRSSSAESLGQQPPPVSWSFDPGSYDNCRMGFVDLRATGLNASDISDDDLAEESGILEQMDPTTLVLVLHTLRRLTHGIIIDPAAGIIM